MKENDITIELQQYLYAKGIYAPAIRFPTVPKGSARIRISLTAEHTNEDIDNLISFLKEF
jgi:8-amino-7-oxononanoate synthase